MDDDDGGEEERRLIDLRLASPQVKIISILSKRRLSLSGSSVHASVFERGRLPELQVGRVFLVPNPVPKPSPPLVLRRVRLQLQTRRADLKVLGVVVPALDGGPGAVLGRWISVLGKTA